MSNPKAKTISDQNGTSYAWLRPFIWNHARHALMRVIIEHTGPMLFMMALQWLVT